jgi:hypothetical protein
MGRRSLENHDHSNPGNGGKDINPDTIGQNEKVSSADIQQGNIDKVDSDRIDFDVAVDKLVEKTGGSSFTVNVDNANVFDISLDQNASIDLTGADVNGVYSATLFVEDNGNTITWDASISWEDGNTPSFSNDLRIISFVTRDGGSTWQGIPSGVF